MPKIFIFGFSRVCLINTVQFNEEAEVKCPYRDTKYACDSALLEREIKAVSMFCYNNLPAFLFYIY